MSAAEDGSRSSLNKSGIDISPVLPLNSFVNVMMFLFNIALATGIVFLNVSVFLSIIINGSLRRHNQYMYMLSTCLSDTCSGISYYYVGVLDVKDPVTGTYFIVPTFLYLSYMAVIAAQADRYHAVAAPFKYSQKITRNRTLLVIFAYWVYAFVSAGVGNLVTTGEVALFTGISTLVANICAGIIMIGVNIRLFFIARYQLERDPPSIARDEKRSSVYLIIVVAAFFICTWSPLFIHSMVCSFFRRNCHTFKNLGTDPLRILPRVNEAITPVLYARCCTPVRESLYRKVWKGCSTKRRVSPETGRWSKVLRGRLFGVLVKS